MASPAPTNSHAPLPLSAIQHSASSARQLDQLNSTALKWASDGELSALDLERIMGRLAAVDPAVKQLWQSA